jgi:hypothetical protein
MDRLASNVSGTANRQVRGHRLGVVIARGDVSDNQVTGVILVNPIAEALDNLCPCNLRYTRRPRDR